MGIFGGATGWGLDKNRYGDKQNKNRWGMQNREHHSKNKYCDEQNMNL